jgi:hypothetical protein
MVDTVSVKLYGEASREVADAIDELVARSFSLTSRGPSADSWEKQESPHLL